MEKSLFVTQELIMWVLSCNTRLSFKKKDFEMAINTQNQRVFSIVVNVLILLLPFSFIIRTDVDFWGYF